MEFLVSLKLLELVFAYYAGITDELGRFFPFRINSSRPVLTFEAGIFFIMLLELYEGLGVDIVLENNGSVFIEGLFVQGRFYVVDRHIDQPGNIGKNLHSLDRTVGQVSRSRDNGKRSPVECEPVLAGPVEYDASECGQLDDLGPVFHGLPVIFPSSDYLEIKKPYE